jgi:hypothetical protein
MREIHGEAKIIRNLLNNSRFAIDYYQREYRWKKKQVLELIEDLTEKFEESHEPGNERSAVGKYGHYFLGSIVISERDGRKFIIDGQQRLTSVTLLLIYLHHRLKSQDHKSQLAELIFSQKYGVRSFNLDVPDRKTCMEALLNDKHFDDTDQSESVVNILARFQDIVEGFPDDLAGEALPYFADWLIENVHFVEITAYSDADAYGIFETMNDRGLSLTPTDMLKGYLLANIDDVEKRNEASRVWRERIGALRQFGKEEDSDAIKSWLRSQHALTIRQRKRGAQSGDFDEIGTEFHRWVRDKSESLGMRQSTDFARFIHEDFQFYTRWYEKLRQVAETLTDGFEVIHYLAHLEFTLQYPAMLSSISCKDSEEQVHRKFRIVASYLDIQIARRIWNFTRTTYAAMHYSLFQQVISQIRGKSVAELAEFLIARLDADEVTFRRKERFNLTGMNGFHIRYLLARMTDYLETCSGRSSHCAEYLTTRGKNGYEIEHIWANHPGRHKDEFYHPQDFSEYRNRIGGLLLLPKSFNASYNDKPYEGKRDHYYGQNLLAQSLHEKCYEHDPGFRRFREESGLNFKPHSEFKKADLDERQELYLNIAEKVWHPDRLRQAAEE